MSTERKAFKDWFDREAATQLAKQIKAVYHEFDQEKFIKKSVSNLRSLEFHDRVQQFSNSLRKVLPDSVPHALKILVRSLPPTTENHQVIADGWLQWPIGQFIADYGLAHYEESMRAMFELTQCFTSEFAVRPFIESYPAKTFRRLLQWTSHPNPHVRRWCSEGVRPRLPWGRKLHALVKDPSPIFPILEKLKDDPDEYVRRSVANNLNDISKDHPDLVLERCHDWSKDASPRRLWIINRALRSLMKNGHTEALAVMGFGTPNSLRTTFRATPTQICMGEDLRLQLELVNYAPRQQRLMVDYKIHYVRQRGKTGSNVFKWKTFTLDSEQKTTLTKKHPMKKTSVRALYPGKHCIEVQVNGHTMAKAEFELR